MAAVLYMYGNAPKNAFKGLIDWDTNAIKMGLLTAYTKTAVEDQETWTAVKADGTEHANANGYTTGGATLGTKTNAYASGVTTFGSASVVWTATGALTAKYAVCYDSVTDNAIFYIDLDGAGGDVTATDANFTITDASGWFSIDVSP
jgi:hypothetical protein